jgi:D-alanyl-D-alanine carboxypeptidase
MNTKAQMLNMTRTHYANTHGLVNSENKSAAIDIALLCEYVMANERFAKIVGTRVYESIIKYKEYPPTIDNNTPVVYKPRTIKFQNTHYLLHKKPH